MFSNGNLFVCLFIVSIQLHHTSLLLSAEAETIRRSNSTNISRNNAPSTATLATRTKPTNDDDDDNVVRRLNESITDGAASFMAKPEQDATELDNYTKSNSNGQGHDDITTTTTTEAGFRIELSHGDIEYEQLPEPMALFGLGKSGSAASSSVLHHLHQSSHHRTASVAATDGLLGGPLPVFPERSDAVYFVVAVIGGAKVWSRTLARSLMELGPPFGSPLGPPLRPLYVDLPPNGRFSVKVLTSLCQQTDGVPLAGVVVIGDGQSARAIAMSGHSMRIPVLWARGGTANIHSTQSEYHATLQSILQPSAREILEAIRALFLQTHWHSFFVLTDVEATMVLAGTEGLPLKQPPLKPTILPLPPADGNVFRQLAEISRSTRGIILLLCNLVSARNVMSEAKRLNMAGGHFIWLWADTSSTAEFFDINKTPGTLVDPTNEDILVDVDRAAEKLLNYPEAVKHFTKTHHDDTSDVVDTTGRSTHRQHTPPTGFHQRGGIDTSWSSFHNTVESQKTGSTAGNTNLKLKQEFNTATVVQSTSEGRYQIGLNEDSYESSEPVNRVFDELSTKANRLAIPFSDEDEYSDEEDGDNDDEGDEDEVEQPNFRKFFESRKLSNVDSDPYNSLLNSGITANETSNHQSPKPKRTSSLHYGINASAASSHVLFHHFKDFPVGLLALRPVKMKVDQAFIRSTIRLFASTWAQVQINAAREQEKHRQRVSINPYGDTLNWLPMDHDQLSLQGRRRRRRGRRRRKRRSVNSSDEQAVIVNSKQNAKHTSVHIENSSSSNSIKFRSDNTNSSRNSTNSTNSNLNINRSGDSNKLNSSFYIRDSKNPTGETSASNSGRSSSNNSSENSSRYSTNSSSGSYNQNLSGLTNQNNRQHPPAGITIINNQSNTRAPSADGTKRHTSTMESTNPAGKMKRASNPWTTTKRMGASSSTTSRRRPVDGDLVSDDIDSKMASRERATSDDGEHLGSPYFTGGCFGSSSRIDERRAELFARALKASTAQAMSGDLMLDGGHREHPLITKFEILNLVPDGGSHTERQLFDDEVTMSSRHRNHHQPQQQQQQQNHKKQQQQSRYPSTKWRRVGLIAGRNVHLDTIVWPGGDIVVSGKIQRSRSNIKLAIYSGASSIGLSAKSRTIFRVVTALAPPFVMASELDEDGLCLRGLPCHRLLPNHKHNLTIMFNNIETQHRFTEDILEHGGKVPSDESDKFPNPKYETKCCYGLSMDLLDNIATELEFEFHLYIVHDELFGAKFSTLDDFMPGRVPFKGGASAHRDTTTPGGVTGKRQQQQQQRSKDVSTGDVSNQYQQQQQQRRYHSPEGRTRTRRRTSSASFERENSLNSNEAVATSSASDARQQRGNLKSQQQRQMAPVANDVMRSRIEADSGDTGNTGAEVSLEDTSSEDDDAVKDVSLNEWADDSPMVHDYNDDQGEAADDVLIDGDTRSEYVVNGKRVQWNGIIGDLISGAADMSFAPLTVSRARAEVIDFSAPYFHGGVSLLAAPQGKSEIPLLAFLLPFSPELWIAIFTSLNVTAIAVAIYEWLSPFGLNPWGRQRSKNFSMSSALWVMWGLLCGHLVAFKAPKSWPNKFLINVWGGFSVIFIASYTANIAALIAGLFFHNAGNTPEVSLFTQRVGAPLSSSTESFLKQHRPHEWEHIKKYTLKNIEEGIRGLKNGTLDLLIGDTPILDYYRAIDHGCNLIRVGETYVEDTYAIGMKKGFPLKDSISALIAKYSSNGYLDILTEKWYGGLPCFKLDNDIIMPRPLGVAAVAGVFLLLGLGITVGVLILIFEHWFYKFMLPKLRHKPKGTVWRSRNIMFFSQKLYRFINCVELVSPHHAARELVHTLRQGQIASLFQKSIKREDEQRRRRKSKAQFFEMIQEIRRVQQAEKMKTKLEVLNEHGESEGHPTIQIPEIITPHSRSPKPRSSPRSKLFSSKHKRSRSNSSTLSVRRFSNDSILSDRLDTIGRRLSRDLTNSPPDFGRRFDTLSASNTGSGSTVKFDISSAKDLSTERIEETKFDTYSGKELRVPVKKNQNRRAQINPDTFKPAGKEISAESSSNSTDSPTVQLLPVLPEGSTQEDSAAQTLLHDKIHEELVTKYGECDYEVIVPLPDSSPPQTASQRTSFRSSSRSPPNLARHRQRSLDGLEQRPKMPSPPRSIIDTDSPRASASRSNLREVSLEHLSREDLLRLSEGTQSEIHEYLSKPATERSSLEPP